MKHFHVTTWGSDEFPDIDEDMDEVPTDLGYKYRYVKVAILVPITYSMIDAALKE